ncbi:two-component system response regulator FixJ [Bradyrhizobium sp. i1.4.4]
MPGNMLSKGEVFVIETDAASREQLSMALQQSAYDVICFADGASLLSEAKARMPACVLLEMPPDRSALDVLKRLREENCMAPVLVTSANGSIAMAVDAIKSGAADFIEKPFRTRDIVDRIDAAIDEFAQPGSNRQRWLPGCEPLTGRESRCARAPCCRPDQQGDRPAHTSECADGRRLPRRHPEEGRRPQRDRSAPPHLRPGFAHPGLRT